jgi:hypothetical protein
MDPLTQEDVAELIGQQAMMLRQQQNLINKLQEQLAALKPRKRKNAKPDPPGEPGSS